MPGATTDYSLTADGVFTAPLVLSFPYNRTFGPVMGRFLTGLKAHRLEGTRGSDDRVHCPPIEFDPVDGVACTEWVAIAAGGEVVAWSWQPEPKEGNPLDRAFAWALVRLDGADTPMLHAVDAGTPDRMRTGMRVTARWADEPAGMITDLAYFEVASSEVVDE